MIGKYKILHVRNGIATVKHKCWFCKRKHNLKYPLDDVGTQSKIDMLCCDCESGLNKFKNKI
jgi:hypothetical protein